MNLTLKALALFAVAPGLSVACTDNPPPAAPVVVLSDPAERAEDRADDANERAEDRADDARERAEDRADDAADD